MQPSVKQWMSGGPVAVERDASALAALDLMVEHGFRHLPVLDAEREVIGIVSFHDLRAALPVSVSITQPLAVEERGRVEDLSVEDVMTDAPYTATVDTPLREAAQSLVDHRIGCLPVVDANGRLDGILTETDMLRALVTALWTEEPRS